MMEVPEASIFLKKDNNMSIDLNDKKSIDDYIASGLTKDAISHLRKLGNLTKLQYFSVLILSGRFALLSKRNQLGLVSESTYMVGMNKINHSVLELNNEIFNSEKHKSKYIYFLIALLIMLLSLLSYCIHVKNNLRDIAFGL